MSTDPQQSDKNVIRKIGPSQVTPTTDAPQWPASYPTSDEIDLVDLGVMFWRRRWLIAVVAGVLIVLTIIAALLKTPTYSYTTTIQLGSMTSATGTLVPLVSPQTAVSSLQSSYIPSALDQYQQQQRVDLSAIKVDAGSAADSNTVTLTCKAKAKHSAACINVEQLAAAAFVKNNAAIVATMRANLQASLGSAELDMRSLKDPAVFGVQKLAAQKAIADAKNTLATLQSTVVLLKTRQQKLQASVGLVQSEVDQLQAHIATVRKAAVASAQGTANPTEAMANLLLGTEIQRSVNLLNGLQQQLAVSLPDQLATVAKDLAENARDQGLQKQVIAQNELALQKLLFSHGQDIQNQQIDIDKLKSQMANLQDNRVLGEPLRSLKPVGLGRGAVLGIGIIISLLLGLFAALCAGYVEQVRARIGSPRTTP